MAEAPKGAAPTLERKKQKHCGFIKLKAWFDMKEATLKVEIFEARGLRPNKSSLPDPYVKMYLMPDPKKKTKQKLSHRKATLNPYFGEEKGWPMANFAEHVNRMLQVSIWDKNALEKNAFLGRTSIKLSEILPPSTPLDGWFELFDPERGQHEWNKITVPADTKGLSVAMYDYTPARGSEAELLIRADDLLEVLSTDGDWTLVRNIVTKDEGYVPGKYLVTAGGLDKEPWFFGPVSRAKAEKLLANLLCKHGAFLIRESESMPGSFSLSMKDGEEVRHYRVENVGDKFKLQGSPSPAFASIADLVQHHKEKKDGLTTHLREPCWKEAPTRPELDYGVKDKWEVPRESVELVGVLGQGQYGEVFRGLWKGSIEVAVKTLKSRESCAEEFLQEAAIMKEMQHPNLIKLYAVCTIGEPIFIIIELMSNGCLLDFLQTERGHALRLPALIDMATDIASGMAYLEMNNYIHRDLAARNVLVGDKLNCKVADFGFARMVQGKEYRPDSPEKFPVRWTAPEAMAFNKYSIKSDVWSFGVLLSEVVTYGQKPYDGWNNKEVVAKIEQGYRMKKPKGCPDGIYAIMTDCWKEAADDRPTFESLAYRLEDFFHSSEANYTDVTKFLQQ